MNRRLHGSVMVEFALVLVVVYLLIAGILGLGRAMVAAQVVQQSSDVLARELSRTPLDPAASLDDALADPSVRQDLFDERLLQIDITPWMQNGQGLTLIQYLEQQHVPMVNRMLVPLMLVDTSGSSTLLRYPGTVADSAGHYWVPTTSGSNTTWMRVIQPAGTPDPFPLAAGGTTGLAALRMNYPVQFLGLMTAPVDAGGTVQPYQRMIYGQAMYRREVFK